MRERWCVAGRMDAEGRFNRVKGLKQIPELLKTLERDVQPSLDSLRKRA